MVPHPSSPDGPLPASTPRRLQQETSAGLPLAATIRGAAPGSYQEPSAEFSSKNSRKKHDRTCPIMIHPRQCNRPPVATIQMEYTARALKQHLSLLFSLWQNTAQLGSSSNAPCCWVYPRQQQCSEPDLEPFSKTNDAIS